MNKADLDRMEQLSTRVMSAALSSRLPLASNDPAVLLLLLDIRDNLDRLVMFHTGGVPAHHEGDHFRVLEEREKNAKQAKPAVADQGVNP